LQTKPTERIVSTINAFSDELVLRVPGRHQALNAAAALALASVLIKKEFPDSLCWYEQRRLAANKAFEEFTGSKRRSEIIGMAGGIIFMDDYGHHPTAIKTTLEGIKNFYPHRRLIVSFMSHTYTRTAALLDGFAQCFAYADLLFLHKIYASAREAFNGKIDGRSLYDAVNNLKSGKPEAVYYADEPLDAFEPLKNILKPGDLFLSLGAGNNWPLGLRLYEYYRDGAK
jgi:UDP-N-acetylmuramate--alanine ligase